MIGFDASKVMIFGGEVYPGVGNYQKFVVDLQSGQVTSSEP